MSDLILRQEDIDRFSFSLRELIAKSNIALAALVHRDGHLLASVGNGATVDTTALSALVSANFSSTVAIANLVGEKEFRTQHHSGQEKSILISLIDDYTFIVSVFANNTPTEPIHACLKAQRDDYVKALDKLYNNEPDGPLPSGDDFESGSQEQQPAAIADAEDVARQQRDKGEATADVVPRRLSYTTKPPRQVSSGSSSPKVIKEPDAEDADLEALANAISSKAERSGPPAKRSAAESADDKEVIVIDGKPMAVVSLKSKKSK